MNGIGPELTTTSVRIAHLRAVALDGPPTFAARIVHSGRTFRYAEVTGRDHLGRVCTTATVTSQVI